MEFLCILQPRKGLVPSRIVGSSHLFSYGRGGGLRAETFGAMFPIGRGKGKDKGKVFRKWRFENVEAKTFLYFYCYCACLIMACHHFFVFLLLYRTLYCKAYFVSLSGDKTNYYVDEILQCLAINVRWSPLVLNNAYYICMEWYSCLDEIWQCFSH